MPVASVAIVGASAAGLAAAVAAARSGARVTLLEARETIGVPPAPAIVGFDFLWPRELPAPSGSIVRRLDGARLRGLSGRGPVVDAPLALYDRTRSDQHLADEARKAGATILTGVDGLDVRSDGALAHAGGIVEADAIVFADGARSLASRFLAATRDPDRLAWGAGLEVRAPGDDTRLTLTFGSHAPGGRSQLTPLGDGRWLHWTFFQGDPAASELLARRALHLDARIQGWSDPKAAFVGVGPDPVYTIPGEFAGWAPKARGDGRRVAFLAAGGAAGQGGLEVGLASGWMAGEAAAAVDPARYQRAWRRRYQRGYRRLRRATDALGRLTDAETSALFAAWEGARLPAAPSARVLLARPRGALALAWAAWLAWARA